MLRFSATVTILLATALSLPGCAFAPRRTAQVVPAARPAALRTSLPAPAAAPGHKAPEQPLRLAPWTGSSSVGDVVSQQPESVRIFELLEIDYCCGGKQTLAEAAKGRGVDPDLLIRALHAIRASSDAASSRNWAQAPLAELLAHIVDTYHARLRSDLPRLDAWVEKVARVHGEAHPELAEVRQRYVALRSAILPHLALEEEQLFPAILASGSESTGETRRLLLQMEADHDDVGQTLHRLRTLTNGYKIPDDACPLYTQMLGGLAALERDLHEHVHLENNVLLPRALALLKDA